MRPRRVPIPDSAPLHAITVLPAVAATALSVESFDGFGAAVVLTALGICLLSLIGAFTAYLAVPVRRTPIVWTGLAIFTASLVIGALAPQFDWWRGGAVWPAGAVWVVIIVAGRATAHARTVADGAAVGGAALTALFSALLLIRTDIGTFTSLAVIIAGALTVVIVMGQRLRRAEERVVDVARSVRQAERTAMARELHDVVAHEVAGISVLAQAGIATGLVDTELLSRIERSSARALTDIRSLVDTLRENNTDEILTAPTGSDPDAIVDMITRFAADYPGSVTVDVDEAAVAGLDHVVLLAAHRILSESLTNIRRHAAGASHVRVGLDDRAGEIHLIVGNSLDDSDAGAIGAGTGSGSGLHGLRERAQSVGGTIDTGVQEGEWIVHAVLPGVRR